MFFKNKIVVISGAGSGIGRATAIQLAQEGATIVASDIHRDNLASTAQKISEAGGRCQTYMVDSTDRDAVFDLANTVISEHGQADIVINNAGIANSARIDELDLNTFQRVMDVDFWGVVHGTQAFIPHMIARDSGHIVNISSIFGWIGVPKQAAYNSAKFAVFGFTEAVRQDMAGSQVKVSCVHPGGIDTPIARNAILPQGQDSDADREEMATRFKDMVHSTPAQAAETIVRGIKKGKPRILIGRDAVMVDVIRRLFPVNYGRILKFPVE